VRGRSECFLDNSTCACLKAPKSCYWTPGAGDVCAGNLSFASPCVLQRLRGHPNIFGGVGDRGMTQCPQHRDCTELMSGAESGLLLLSGAGGFAVLPDRLSITKARGSGFRRAGPVFVPVTLGLPSLTVPLAAPGYCAAGFRCSKG
jgi:hypothetical protein